MEPEIIEEVEALEAAPTSEVGAPTESVGVEEVAAPVAGVVSPRAGGRGSMRGRASHAPRGGGRGRAPRERGEFEQVTIDARRVARVMAGGTVVLILASLLSSVTKRVVWVSVSGRQLTLRSQSTRLSATRRNISSPFRARSLVRSRTKWKRSMHLRWLRLFPRRVAGLSRVRRCARCSTLQA